MSAHNQSHHQRAARPVYNSPNREMFLPSRAHWVWIALLVFVRMSVATDWHEPEAQLAEKIVAVTGPGVIALDLTNLSSISTSDVEEIRRELVSSLAASGVRVWQPDQASATVKVTLSENLQNYVWVAEIQQGTNDASVLMVSTSRPETALTTHNTTALTLSVTPLVSQADPILDAAVLEGGPRRVVALGANQITIYEFRDGHWVEGQSLVINHPFPFPRDVRGRIILRKDHLFDAYLPGLVCHSTNSAPLSMNCAHSDDPWPLQNGDFGVSAFFSPTRNFFPGVLVPGVGKQKSAPQFYSAAALPKANYVLWIFSGTDGQLHLLDGINEQTAGKTRWGSDIAAVHAACRPDWQVLATSADSDSEDSMQAFEFPDREPVLVSQKLMLNGHINALWTAQNADSAVAVYRDAESGNYEAVQLNLACSQ